MILLNPPVRRRKARKSAPRKRRLANGRFTRRKSRAPAARKRRKPMARARARRRRRNPIRKFGGGPLMAQRTAPRRRRRKATSKRRRRRSTARAPKRRRRRSTARRASPRRRRRSTSRRRRGVKLGRHRPVLYKSKRGWRQKRRGKLGLKGKTIRVNPALGIPSIRDVTGILKQGAYAGIGWVGVNGVLMGADYVGLGRLKEGRDPKVVALINAAVRILATPIVAWAAGRVFGGQARTLALVGGSLNVVYHGAQDIAAQTTVLPVWAAPLLLGYDGVSDYVTNQTMGDYISQLPGEAGDARSAGEGTFVMTGMPGDVFA